MTLFYKSFGDIALKFDWIFVVFAILTFLIVSDTIKSY